jgi:hypothetical protein
MSHGYHLAKFRMIFVTPVQSPLQYNLSRYYIHLHDNYGVQGNKQPIRVQV